MSTLITRPEAVAAAAADIAEIRSTIGVASAAAASATGSLLPAAADEVSSATATLFNAYAHEYQAVAGAASAFHERFAQALAGSGLAYAQTEAANAASTALGSLVSSLQGAGVGAANSAAGVTTIVLGASGYPIPWQIPDYVNLLPQVYIEQLWGSLGTVVGLATPEGLYPLTGIKDLTFNVSVARGLEILDHQIQTSIASGSTTINIFGYSQSAAIVSLEMQALNPTNTPGGSLLPSGTNLQITLVGDVSNPNGGLLSRFPDLSLPSLGITFGTSTPANSFPTKIFTIEYDGFADFPQYPLNIVSDINAFFGIAELHGTYPYLDPSTAIQLTNTVGATQTEYFIYQSQNLPLLDPVRAIPFVGNPIADLVQPDLKVIVDLGYGSTTQGWSPNPPNVQTGFGVLPPVSPGQIASALGAGTQQGIAAFTSDVHSMLTSAPPTFTLPSLPTTTGATTGSGFTPPTANGVIGALQSANSNFFDAASLAVSDGYATLLPTADIVNAAVLSLPSYDVNLFLSGVEQAFDGDPIGGLTYAIGAPIAADTGLLVLATGFEFRVLDHAVTGIVDAFNGTTNPLNP